MVTDEQVRRLKRLSKTEKNQELAAVKAGMDRKTARDYLGDGRLPSERKEDRNWRTRSDPFTEVWERIREQIATNPGLEARTLFKSVAAAASGQVCRRPVADAATAAEALARDCGAGAGSLLRAAARGGATGAERLHAHGRVEHHHWRPEFSTSAVSLRADVLELGGRVFVLFGELREPQRRTAKCAVGTGWRTAGPPDRPDVAGGE